MASPAVSPQPSASATIPTAPIVSTAGKSISVISASRPEGMPAFADFRNAEYIMSLIAPKFHTAVDLPQAVLVILRVYQTGSRQIAPSTYEYCLDGEILAWAMNQVKATGGIVAELGAGTGENGILLGYAGAKLVLLNDLEPKEAARFAELRKLISPSIPIKFDSGDCIHFMKKQELIGKVNLVLCRNLIHYFNGEKLGIFARSLHHFLPAKGQAIITANSVYEHGAANQEFFEAHADVSTFGSIYCVYTDRDLGMGKPTFIFRKFFPIPDKGAFDAVLSSSSDLRIYERTSGKDWVVDKEAYQQVPAEFKADVKAAFDANKKAITKIKNGSVRVVTTHARRFFNTKTLPAVFEQAGFKVVHTFVLNNFGHLVQGDLFRPNLTGSKEADGVGQVGVIIQK